MSKQDVEVREELTQEDVQLNQAYMNRLFCTTRERVGYILKSALGGLNLGKYDLDSELFLYKLFGLSPTSYAKALVGFGIYDMVNDPISALIIDNMRSRWGKFKPFQYLALLPNLLIGFFTCILPAFANQRGYDEPKRLNTYVLIKYMSETVNAFVGGGGYIDKVFTPNPNERTSMLVVAKFFADVRLPEQIFGVLWDLADNGKIDLSTTGLFVTMKLIIFVITTTVNVYWIIVSRERVPQTEKPPHPIKGLLSVFTNKPLLIRTLSGVVDGIDIGTSEQLYYSDVLHFVTLPMIAGIPGGPISYASYPLATKFRAKYSTKRLWLMQRLSIFISEGAFLLVGMIGGKTHGLYRKKIPMAIAFGLGNCLEMVFYGTKKIVGDEIDYEVLDYCEWKNGYRVEATISLITGYFNKLKDIFLRIINAWLLEKWAGYQIGMDAVQTEDTMWKMFVASFAPRLCFDALSMIPMMFYNIDRNTRERMYLELEQRRAADAAKLKELTDAEDESSENGGGES